jgi:DNA-binding GntR family transcriptional regulator
MVEGPGDTRHMLDVADRDGQGARSVVVGERRIPARRPGQGRRSAADAVHQHLRRAILDLDLPPGTALHEKRLTAEHGVSRTPVREALIRLAEEGLVEIFPQSGTFVGRIPAAALPEAVVVREALEAKALSLAIVRATAVDHAALAAIIARQEACAAADARAAFHRADEQFHEAIAAIAGHPGLWRMAEMAKTQIDRCRRLTLPVPGRMLTVIAEHRAILAAIETQDEAAAQAALAHHLNAVIPDAATLRHEHPGYFV